MQTLDIYPIGVISSCYKEKFGIPRQPGLVKCAKGQLVLDEKFNQDSVRGLEQFSHIWLNFIFHATYEQGWKALVRPPRLGGNTKLGVFATRSNFRPNAVGQSVVELESVDINQSIVTLHLSGCDLLDGTPIIDIKPYLPYADCITDARGGFANQQPITHLAVYFSTIAQSQCQEASKRLNQDIEKLIIQILGIDPRPSYQQGEISDRIYSMKLCDFDLKWQYCENNKIKVLGLLWVATSNWEIDEV